MFNTKNKGSIRPKSNLENWQSFKFMGISMAILISLSTVFVSANAHQGSQSDHTKNQNSLSTKGQNDHLESRNLIQNAIDKTKILMSNPALSRQEKLSQFTALLDKILDIPTIGKQVAPSAIKTIFNEKKSSAIESREKFLKLLKNSVILNYFTMLETYCSKNGEFKILSASERSVTVQIKNPANNQPVDLTWEMHQRKIIDLKVSGASMKTAKKTEYAELARKTMANGAQTHEDQAKAFLVGLERIVEKSKNYVLKATKK